MKPLLIAGIDPGTTTGYALLDTEGSFIMAGSSRELGRDRLIALLMRHGKVVLIGSDKKSTPGFIEKLGVKIGAKVITPPYDLSVAEKKQRTQKFGIKNPHQRDALASALYAFKRQRALLKKIETYVKHHNLFALHDQIIAFVLKHDDLSIAEAVEQLQKPIAVQPKLSHQPLQTTSTETVHRSIEKENKLLREQNLQLKAQIHNLQQIQQSLKKKMSRLKSQENGDKQVRFKEERIRSLDKSLSAKDDLLDAMKQEKDQLHSFLTKTPSHIILKKMKNLGSQEYERMRNVLAIDEGDILLIDDAYEVSKHVTDILKTKVSCILIRKGPRQLPPFVVLDAKGCTLEETGHFALLSKEEFERLRKKQDILGQILDEYKASRHH